MTIIRFLLLIILGMSLGIGYMLWDLNHSPSLKVIPVPQEEALVTQVVPAPKVEMRHVIGNVDAPLDVKFFTSLTCTFCKEIHDTILPELAAYCEKNRQVKITILPVPSDKIATDAGYLLECAKPDQFPLIMKSIYDQQDMFFSNGKEYLRTLENIGNLAGVSQDAYAKCRLDKDLTTRIFSVYLLMRKYGLDEAPTFVVGDKILLGNYTAPRLIEWIEFMLKNEINR